MQKSLKRSLRICSNDWITLKRKLNDTEHCLEQTKGDYVVAREHFQAQNSEMQIVNNDLEQMKISLLKKTESLEASQTALLTYTNSCGEILSQYRRISKEINNT